MEPEYASDEDADPKASVYSTAMVQALLSIPQLHVVGQVANHGDYSERAGRICPSLLFKKSPKDVSGHSSLLDSIDVNDPGLRNRLWHLLLPIHTSGWAGARGTFAIRVSQTPTCTGRDVTCALR